MKRTACIVAAAAFAPVLFAGWVKDGVRAEYVEAAAVAPAGVYDFGASTAVVVGGQASCYRAAPSGEWTLAVAAGVPRYPFQIRLESAFGFTHGAAIINDNGWAAGSATNMLYFFPAPGSPTNWMYWGVAR